MLAKLIVTGATRAQALQRSRRALAEMEIEGHAHRPARSTAPWSRTPISPPPTGPFKVHTRWIETEFDNAHPAVDPAGAAADADDAGTAPARHRRGRRQAP